MSSSDTNTQSSGAGVALLVPSAFRGYAAKFGVAILVVLVVIGGIGFWGLGQASDTVTESAQERLKQSTALQADALSEWVTNKKSQVQSVSSNPEANRDGNLQRLLQEKENQLSGVQAIHYVELNENGGTVVESSSNIQSGTPLSEVERSWSQLRAGEDLRLSSAYSSSVWVSDRTYTVDGTPRMAFASPVGNGNDVVVIEGDGSRHFENAEGTGVNMIVVNANNETVAPGSDFDMSIHTAEIARTRSSAVTTDTNFSGLPYKEASGSVFAYSPIAGQANWVVVGTQSQSAAFAARRDVEQTVLFIVGGGLLSLLLVGGVLARSTVAPLNGLRDRANEMEEGNLDVDLQTSRKDEIGELYGAFGAMRDSLKQQIQRAEEARKEAESAREEAERLNEHLERKADDYSDVMQSAADGNLTRRMDPESESQAMTEIANEYNTMVSEIETTVVQLQEFASSVAAASEAINASATEVDEASQEVSESVQEISEGAERQNERFQVVSREMDQLSSTTQEIASSSNQVADVAERTADAGRTGRKAAEAAVEGMTTIEEESKTAVDEIDRLDEEMEQIDELIDFISDVAEQTNMLALNANIEASRAGSGEGDEEGFGVVAQEIKELANDTQEAASDIEELLERIREQTEVAVEEVRNTSEKVAEHKESVEDAAEALSSISSYAETTNEGIQEISAASEEQASSTEEVVSVVEEAADISEQTASEAEDVASAAQRQTAALSAVTDSITSLSDRAEDLEQQLYEFEASEDSGSQSTESPPEAEATPGDED